MGAQIRLGEIFGEDEIDGGSASESGGGGVGIFDVSDEGLGVEIGERSELLWVAGNGANLLAFGEQHLCCDASGASGCIGDDDHGGPPVNCARQFRGYGDRRRWEYNEDAGFEK